MKDYLYAGLTGAVAVCLGVFVGLFLYAKSVPQTGGDFAGGVVPVQLLTANVSTNSVTPVLSNLYLNGAVSVGGTEAGNQITAFYTATTSYPAASATLGAITASTSTTSTNITFTAPGFAVGDYCNVSYNGATTTSAFGMDGEITAYSTSTNQATATVTFWNGSSSAITFTPTSSFTGVSSTVKATCYHTGV